jgi:hypothetical protein
MIPSPFAKRRSAEELAANQRRSTRVDYVCPVVVSGRDATGQPFRVETETSTVNLHGCKLKISHTVMVGMVVTLETPHAAAPAKAICVHVWDSPRGQTQHDVAVQLLRPRNLWGLQNPPADWQLLAGALVNGAQPANDATSTPSPKPAPPPAPSTPDAPQATGRKPGVAPAAAVVSKPGPTAPNPSPTVANAKRAAAPAVIPPSAPVAPVSRPGPGAPAVSKGVIPSPPAAIPSASPPARSAVGNATLTEVEERSWQLMDSVLQVLRDQTEELIRGALEEFRQQVGALVKDGEKRLKQRAEQSYADVESSISTLRRDIAEQLTQRTGEIVESAQQAVQERVTEMFSTMLTSSQTKSAKPPSK